MDSERRVSWLRRLGVVLTVWTFVLMGVGAWVKATGSGLACPDWPQCYGQWLPPFPSMENGGIQDGAPDSADAYTQSQVLYEWAHRAIASLLGIPFLAFVALALGGKELSRPLRFLPVAAGIVLAVQVGLGGGTVLKGNPAELTTMHLLTATLFFACIVTATCFAFLRPLPTAAPAVRPHAAQAAGGADPMGSLSGTPGEPTVATARTVAYVYPDETPAPAHGPGEGV